MDVIVLSILICFFIIAIFISMIIVIHSNNIKGSSVQKTKGEFYQNCILEFAFDDKSSESCIYEKNKIDEEFINQAIIIMNSFTGEIRKKLSLHFDSMGFTDFLYKKYEKTRNKAMKEYYIYQIGELRSKKYLDILLEMNVEKLINEGLYKGYFFALNSITNEWINKIETRKILLYIEKIFNFIEIIEKQEKINLIRLMEILMNDTEDFFNYLIKNKDIKEYFMSLISNSNISNKSKGEIIYILAINKVYEIIPIIKKELELFPNLTADNAEDLEYIILLVKSCGELNTSDTEDVIINAGLKGKWIIKSIAAKYLWNNPTEINMELLYSMLFDKVWWVRSNAAVSLDKIGDEGFGYLLRALVSDDKYAKETASNILSTGKMYDRIRLFLIEGETDFVIRDLKIIINNSLSLGIVDRLLNDKYISSFIKCKIIEVIETKAFIKYFDESLKNKDLEESIFIEAKLKYKEILTKEVGEII